MKWIWRKIMAFGDIFKDDNNINEKNVIGFMSFAVMTVFAVVDLTTGYFGKDLVINEFIYNSFVWITLGCFGIAGIEKFAKKVIQAESLTTMNIAEEKMILLKSTPMMAGLGLTSVCTFIGTYLMNLTMGNSEQYMAVLLVLVLDGFFGIIAGMQKRGVQNLQSSQSC